MAWLGEEPSAVNSCGWEVVSHGRESCPSRLSLGQAPQVGCARGEREIARSLHLCLKTNSWFRVVVASLLMSTEEDICLVEKLV